METVGLQSVGNVFFGNSLITNQSLTVEDKTAQPLDRYVPVRASVGADHESLKTIGSASHAAVTKKIEEIANNPALTDKEKRAQINELRKQLGLSKGDMKKFFTKPLERAYAQKIEQLKATGIDTPEKQKLLEDLESKKKLHGSMYKAGGCVKKVFKGIGGVFKGIAKTVVGVVKGVIDPRNWIKPAFWKNVVAPLAISFIPGIGPLAATAYRYGMAAYNGVKAISSLAKGKFMDAFNYGANSLAGFSTSAYNKVAGAVQKAADQAGRWVDQGVSYYQKGMEIYRNVTELPKRWLDDAKNWTWL